MKTRIKLDLYVLKEYFIETLLGKKYVRKGLSKKKKKMVVLKCGRGRSPKSQINTGCEHLQHEGLPGIVGS